VPVPTPIDYPRPAVPFTLPQPPQQQSMPDPCAGVPANAFCATLTAAVPEVPAATVPALVGASVAALGGFLVRRRWRRTRR
jgi:hypothetical protein